MNIKSQNKLLNLLFESGENPVVTTEEDRFHLEDCIQYATKPGIIVATIKGDSESGIQQLPIGAVDSFRFMKVMDENAITNQEKNNGKSYDSILKEYEGQKNQIIDQWKKSNLKKLEEVKYKYGNRFLGIDIVENQKQIQHKEEEKEDDQKEKANGGNEEIIGKEQSNEIEQIEEADSLTKILGGLYKNTSLKDSDNIFKKIMNSIADKVDNDEETIVKLRNAFKDIIGNDKLGTNIRAQVKNTDHDIVYNNINNGEHISYDDDGKIVNNEDGTRKMEDSEYLPADANENDILKNSTIFNWKNGSKILMLTFKKETAENKDAKSFNVIQLNHVLDTLKVNSIKDINGIVLIEEGVLNKDLTDVTEEDFDGMYPVENIQYVKGNNELLLIAGKNIRKQKQEKTKQKDNDDLKSKLLKKLS